MGGMMASRRQKQLKDKKKANPKQASTGSIKKAKVQKK